MCQIREVPSRRLLFCVPAAPRGTGSAQPPPESFVPLSGMPDQIVTRFAPSPTGFLHIGGARTALFNWLYARGRGGRRRRPTEDPNRERSTQAAIDAILDGLAWLGITWDGDPVYQ